MYGDPVELVILVVTRLWRFAWWVVIGKMEELQRNNEEWFVEDGIG